MTKKYRKLGVLLATILMIVGIVMMFNKYNAFHTIRDEENNRELNQLASYYNTFFNSKFDKLQQVATDNKVITYFEEVKTDYEIETHYNYSYVYQSIIDLQQSDVDIDYAFVASNHVRSFLCEPDFDAPDYVASERKWFQETIVTDDIYITPIYIDAFSGIPVITLSLAIKGNDVHGVMAMDVNLLQIVDYVTSNGKTMIIDNGQIYDFMNKTDTYDVQSTDSLIGLDEMIEGVHEVEYKGTDYNIHIKKDPSTGHHLAILEEFLFQKKMMVSSLLQTFFVFFVLSIISIVAGITLDNKTRRNLYKEEA